MSVIEYDAIAIGTGSAMNVIDALLHRDPNVKVAVIDKDEPGGICLTRGCIPSKILLHVADMVTSVKEARKFHIDVELKGVNFKAVMERMRSLIREDIEMIRRGLSSSPNIDYYPEVAEFVAPYTIKVGDKLIESKLILVCSGSKPKIPPIKGIDSVRYHTSDTIFHIDELPQKLVIVGGGYIAAEFGYFFSSMGSDVTIVGRNPQFLPQEEEEISFIAKKHLSQQLDIFTNHEVVELRERNGVKEVIAVNRATGEKVSFEGDEVLIAAGRAPNSDILKPEKGGIETWGEGWIKVNEYMETNVPGIYSCGDANGKYLFKHVANYESKIIYYNAILGKKVKMSYHAVPHAVFIHPEVASVGMKEEEALKALGADRVLIGFYRYEDTAKGLAMDAKDYFVKVIVDGATGTILGAHIVGPHASILIHEVIALMYSRDPTLYPIVSGMHIHPALSEVVERAFQSLMDVHSYHHVLAHHLGLIDHHHHGHHH